MSSPRIRQLTRQIMAPLVVSVIVLLLWQLTITLAEVPSIVVPSPLAVARALVTDASALTFACLQTAKAAFTGLAISICVGVLTAFAFSQSSLIRSALYPYAILLQTVPIIAVAPIVVIAVERGFYGVTLIASIISIFPIITSTTTGLLQVDPRLLELFRLHAATRWQTLWKLQLPHALPYLVSGIRIAGGAAIVGAIVGEFFVGSSLTGLGVMIERRKSGFDTDALYATVFVSTLLGVCTFALVTVVGEWVLRRFFAMSMGGRQGR